MAGSGHRLETMEDLFVQQLEDIYGAEHQLLKALPKMAQAAHDPELRSAFEEHTEVTKQQIERLEEIFGKLGKSPKKAACKGMQGLIEEGEEMISAEGDEAVLDAGLIAAAQRVEHYEIAGYGCLRTFAEHLNNPEVVDLLEETLEEEKEADELLTEAAETRVNPEAEDSDEDEEDWGADEEDEESEEEAASGSRGKSGAKKSGGKAGQSGKKAAGKSGGRR